MSVLVLLLLPWKGNRESDLIQQISNKATVLVTESFSAAAQAAAEKPYRLTAILTTEEDFPSTWKTHQLPLRNPTLIFTGANRLHVHLLNSLIDSVETYRDLVQDNSLFHRSLVYIDENLCENDLSLEKVASHIYVSRCHYSRMFQKVVGIGFKEYIMNKRIEKAKIFLEKGDPVTDVCYSVGYNDLTHFSRVFKRMVGVNPSIYRQSKYGNSIVWGGVS